MKYVRIGVLGFAALLLASCSVGPKYARPSVPSTPTYKEPPPDSFKESNGWKPAQPNDQTLRGNWWEMFGDPQLNQLESQIAVSNQNLKIAEAQYREARAMVRYNRASSSLPSRLRPLYRPIDTPATGRCRRPAVLSLTLRCRLISRMKWTCGAASATWLPRRESRLRRLPPISPM